MSISPFRSTAAVAAVVAGSFTFLGSPAPAGAQTCYPPSPGCLDTTTTVAVAGPALVLSATTVRRGQVLGASISGCSPGTSGIITIGSPEQQIGAFTMPATGLANASATIPTNIALGAQTVFVRCTGLNGQPASASRGVTVVAAGGVVSGGTGGTSTSGGNLARTGAVVIPTALVGVGLVLGGVALKRSSRRGKAGTAG